MLSLYWRVGLNVNGAQEYQHTRQVCKAATESQLGDKRERRTKNWDGGEKRKLLAVRFSSLTSSHAARTHWMSVPVGVCVRVRVCAPEFPGSCVDQHGHVRSCICCILHLYLNASTTLLNGLKLILVLGSSFHCLSPGGSSD